jgi:hypothetical protein
MRRPKLTRPVVELFSDGEILDVNMLHRNGAFRSPLWYPLRRLKTFPDHIEINFRDRNRPPLVLLIERTGLHLGGTRPWFVCACGRRCGKIYLTSIDARCRVCSDLQFRSQRQRLKAQLQTKAEKIRNRLWFENDKPIRPHYMHRATFQRHLRAISRIEHAIRHGLHCASIRYRRYRERDDAGCYCDGPSGCASARRRTDEPSNFAPLHQVDDRRT